MYYTFLPNLFILKSLFHSNILHAIYWISIFVHPIAEVFLIVSRFVEGHACHWSGCRGT